MIAHCGLPAIMPALSKTLHTSKVPRIICATLACFCNLAASGENDHFLDTHPLRSTPPLCQNHRSTSSCLKFRRGFHYTLLCNDLCFSRSFGTQKSTPPPLMTPVQEIRIDRGTWLLMSAFAIQFQGW